MQRRDFLKLTAGTLANADKATPASEAASVSLSQNYGTGPSRTSFRDRWRDTPGHSFQHHPNSSFHRLQTGFDVVFSRCQQDIYHLQGGAVTLSIKLLCSGEAGRSLFALGIKSSSHGCWAFTLGAPGRSLWDTAGWQILTNAANPIQELVALDGYDHHDWHTFVIVVHGASSP